MERLLVLGRGWLGTATAEAGRTAGMQVEAHDRSTRPDVFASSSDAALHRAIGGADAVVNACGCLRGDDEVLRASNTDLARTVARAAAAAGKRLVHVGSAAEYGPPSSDRLREDDPTAPTGAYGRTKLAGTAAVLEESTPGQTVVARVFNPVGPGQPVHQPVAEFARAAREGQGPIVLRNAATERDFVSIHDVGSALVALAELATLTHGIVNVCSGVGLRYGDIARAMLHRLGSERAVESLEEPTLLRVVGDPTRLARMTARRLPASAELMARLALAAV